MKLTIARLTLVALLLLAVALAAGAQGPRKVRMGYLSGNPPSDTRDALAGFRTKLRELGYVEGDNLTIDLRYANGGYELLPDLAADLVRLKVDLIFSYGTPGSLAAKSTTSTIPIVFTSVSDPVEQGFVSLPTEPAAGHEKCELGLNRQNQFLLPGYISSRCSCARARSPRVRCATSP